MKTNNYHKRNRGGGFLKVLLLLGLAFAIFCSVRSNMMATSTDDDLLKYLKGNALAAVEPTTIPSETVDELVEVTDVLQTEPSLESTAEDENPIEIANPVETQPAVTDKLSETTTEPTESNKPVEPTRPAKTENPESVKLDETKPEATEPTKPTKPVETRPEEQKSKPTEATKPTESTKPTEPSKPTVTYKTVDEQMYVTASILNVRTGPSTDSKKVAELEKNAQVRRVGIGSNGWSQIKLDGKIVYVSSKYLSTKKATQNQTSTQKPAQPQTTEKPAQSTTQQSTQMTFTKVNQTMFTNEEWVTVYMEPSVKAASFMTFGQMNSAIKVTGVSEDSKWCKIERSGKTGYIQSKYLSNTKTYPPVKSEMKSRDGMIGRLFIEDLYVSVALFGHDVNKNSQAIVDGDDSAAYLYDTVGYRGFDIIAEHSHQEFANLKKAKTGKTIATIDFGTYTQQYICVDVFEGVNTKNDLVDMDGNTIAGRNDGGICMYTCNPGITVTITFWQPI